MSERTSPSPSAPTGTKNESHLGVTFDPKTKEALYQTYVPHGERLTIHTKVYLLEGYTCTAINITLDGEAWVQTGHTKYLETDKSGITCMISDFAEKTADITIVNKNDSDHSIVLGFSPIFKKGDSILEAADPQIVLPPSKAFELEQRAVTSR